MDSRIIEYSVYNDEENQLPIMNELIQKDLSEPYSIYTYRYFTLAYPSLSLIATHNGNIIATCISKLDAKKNSPEEKRGYIGMLAVSTEYRKLGIARNLVAMSLQEMKRLGACEVVLETEETNKGALALYQSLGFIREKRLQRYYLNGVDAFRLKLLF